MSQLSPFLKPINSKQEAPPETYIIYNLAGEIFYIRSEDYTFFSVQWIGNPQKPSLSLDLSTTRTHSLVLDFDFHDSIPTSNVKFASKTTLLLIQTTLKSILIPFVKNFTYIIACRDDNPGIHIHLPEFDMAFDDYICFCESIQHRLSHQLKNRTSYTLDIPQNIMLSGASKPQTNPYKPFQFIYIDEMNCITICFNNIKTDLEKARKTFRRRKDNAHSFFRKIINNSMFETQINQIMMPIITILKPIYTLSYRSQIAPSPNTSPDWFDIACYTDKQNNVGYMSKNKQIDFKGTYALKLYHYLLINAVHFDSFKTVNHALKMWFQRFKNHENDNINHIPTLFHKIHRRLQMENPIFIQNTNPLKTLLQYNNAYYFLPVFYTLYQLLPSDSFMQEIYCLVDDQYHYLLDRIRQLDAKLISLTNITLTFSTLQFCSNNLYQKPNTMRKNLKLIIRNYERNILSATTNDQIMILLRNIQESHFPIQVLKLRNALKKPARYIWNFLSESWQEVGNNEITDHMVNLWTNVKSFLLQYHQTGGMGGPDKTVIEKFNINSVVSAILSDSFMERFNVQLDTHKWFLRLQNGGALDLLTSHIGGVVPEYYMSDRRMGIEFSREHLMELCNTSPHLEKIYFQMTDEDFFLRYLKKCLLDESHDLFGALSDLVEDYKDDFIVNSMLHFYVHMCKYMSFEYDMLMYVFDILASIFIGTNYERKFFVLKGITRNGKSKLFELLGRVFGGYYHGIQSENLAPQHTANTASPELASTLFSCRIVASEELEGKLNENRVKQITGNSLVTFRNMYEQNSGGIPIAKLFVNTNNYPKCISSEAFQDRTVAIPFDADFVDNCQTLTSRQVSLNTFPKESYVIEESYQGCFLILYYHLKKYMNLEDGYLHYRKEPEYIIDFTREYLVHTDIYVQFKIHMDVQQVAGCITTMNDIKSAVRQFLKTTKNISYHEIDLFIRFEKEFKKNRRTDIQLGSSFQFSSITDGGITDPLEFENPNLIEECPSRKKLKGEEKSSLEIANLVEEEDPAAKKFKREEPLSLVYYENIIIKNLKRTHTDANLTI